MKLLIDADVISYRAACAAEHTKYLCMIPHDAGSENVKYFDDAKSAKESGGVVWSRKELQPEDTALMITDTLVQDILARYAPAKAVLFLTGIGNYRTSIATRATYKGNRSGTPAPTHLKAVRKHLIHKWAAEVSQGEEADDAIARAWQEDPTSVICTTDKDFNQLAARLYNFVDKEEVKISAKDACKNFYAQVISGDPVDSIPGVTGYGPVKSKKALADCTSPLSCWQRTVDIYKTEYDTKGLEYALESARLVKIGQPKGVLWVPPIGTR